MPIQIDFQYESTLIDIPTPDYFQHWVEKTLEETVDSAELCLRIVDNKEMAELNQQYRQKEGATNVLAFPAQIPAELSHLNILGDIIICAPVVLQEAQTQNKISLHHWAHLTIHGLLHLRGYDHQTEQEARIMEGQEIIVMQKLSFPNPYSV